MQNNWLDGTMTSTVIGPAFSWESLHWNVNNGEAGNGEDSSHVKLYGIANDGSKTLIVDTSVVEGDVYSLSSLDASIYPNLELQLYLSDDSLRTPQMLGRWQVLYEEIPEAALNPLRMTTAVLPDSIQQGEEFVFTTAIENISATDMSPIQVVYWIIDANFNTWLILDHWSSYASIIITSMYYLRIRPPKFYLLSCFTSTLLLIFKLSFGGSFAEGLVLFLLFSLLIINYKIIKKYLIMFTFLSIISLFSSLLAFFFINEHFFINNIKNDINNNIIKNTTNNTTNNTKGFINDYDNYYYPFSREILHSCWHIFIFLTAGLVCHTRLLFDNILYPNVYNRTRTRSSSL